MSDWDDDLEDGRPREDESFAQRVIPDFVKKAIMTGVGAVFMTEEGLRGALTDMKVPKEAMSSLVAQADKTKREVIQTLARELRAFLDDLELEDLLKKSLEGTTFEIHTTIRVTRDDEGEVGLAVLDKNTKLTRPEDDKPKAKKKSTKKKKASRKKSAGKKVGS
jgi:hypothetical protein